MKRLLFLLSCLCSLTSVSAQTTEHQETLDITVTTPGTLGDLILAQTENFSDVKTLTVSGTLSSADYTTIKSRLTSLVNLDMDGVNTTALSEEFLRNHDLLETVVLPSTLTSISKGLFYDCNRLETVVIPDGVTTIDTEAFYYCSCVESLTLPATLVTIGSNAFQYCWRLKEITLPQTVRRIGRRAFANCSNLKEIHLPNEIAYLDEYVFEDCSSLLSFTFPSGITEVPYGSLIRAKSLERVVVPEGVTTINGCAFEYCTKLVDVKLPSTLVNIEAQVFGFCDSLQSITLPASLRFMNYNCFYDDYHLASVTCLGVNPPTITAQYGAYSNPPLMGATVRVPALGVTAYKQKYGWDKQTIESVDELPAPLVFYNDQRITLPATLPADYQPAMSILEGRSDNTYYQFPAVTISGEPTLSLSSFNMCHAPHASYTTSWKLYSSFTCQAPIRANGVSVSYRLDSHKRWLFFSLPFNARVADINFLLDSDFSICYYSGEQRAAGALSQTWKSVSARGMLKAGQGYIIKCSKDKEVVTFNAVDDDHKNDIFRTADVTVDLETWPAELAHNRSWNFIGNPFPAYYDTRLMDFNAPFVIWDDSKSTPAYATYTPYDDDYVLSPGEGFFLQCPVDKTTVTFPAEGRQDSRSVRTLPAGSRRLPAAEVRTVYNLTLTDGNSSDRTRFVVNERMTTAYDYGRDATKLQGPAGTEPALQLWTSDVNGLRYSIQERPVADGIVHLGMSISTAGQFTLSLPTVQHGAAELWLVDHQAGERILLNPSSTEGEEGGSYTFYAEAGTLASRFTLELGCGITAVPSVATESQQTEPAYDLAGRRIDSSLFTPHSSLLRKGIYIIGGKKHIVK